MKRLFLCVCVGLSYAFVIVADTPSVKPPWEITVGGYYASEISANKEQNDFLVIGLKSGEDVDPNNYRLEVHVLPTTNQYTDKRPALIQLQESKTASGETVWQSYFPNLLPDSIPAGKRSHTIRLKGKSFDQQGYFSIRIRILSKNSVAANTNSKQTETPDQETEKAVDTTESKKPTEKEEKTYLPDQTVIGKVGSGFESTFNSTRVISELILGETFALKYDDDGECDGFTQNQLLAELRFDDLLLADPRKGMLHTGIVFQFSSFPVEETATQNAKFTDYADSFTGCIYAKYFPDFLCLTTESSNVRGLPVDARNWGFILKAGFTTRENMGKHRDATIVHGGLGMRFEHVQMAVIHDTTNRPVLRWFEIACIHFQEYGNKRNANRCVIEAGMRLFSIGRKGPDFYGAFYANLGEGADDVRLFLGMSFKIDKIVTFR